VRVKYVYMIYLKNYIS